MTTDTEESGCCPWKWQSCKFIHLNATAKFINRNATAIQVHLLSSSFSLAQSSHLSKPSPMVVSIKASESSLFPVRTYSKCIQVHPSTCIYILPFNVPKYVLSISSASILSSFHVLSDFLRSERTKLPGSGVAKLRG